MAALVTHSLTLIDVTLTCEDVNLTLVEVVTGSDEKSFDASLVQICNLIFGHKAIFLLRL